MRIAILGRTENLLNAAKFLIQEGHEISLVGTCGSETYYTAREKDFENFAQSIGADFFGNPRINEPKIVEKLTASKCDIAISINWLSIIEKEACEAFPLGILNVHAGDLPRYRGNACANWAILNKEKQIGLTLHKMIPGELDNGDILLKKFYHLSENTYITDIYCWLEKTIPSLITEGIRLLESGAARWEKQSLEPKTWLRCYPRKPEDSYIDWSLDAFCIHRLIRASSKPFSGSFSYLNGKEKVHIWRADVVEHLGAFLAVPGQVCYKEDGFPVIATGNNRYTLKILEASLNESEDDALGLIAKSMRNRLTSSLA